MSKALDNSGIVERLKAAGDDNAIKIALVAGQSKDPRDHTVLKAVLGELKFLAAKRNLIGDDQAHTIKLANALPHIIATRLFVEKDFDSLKGDFDIILYGLTSKIRTPELNTCIKTIREQALAVYAEIHSVRWPNKQEFERYQDTTNLANGVGYNGAQSTHCSGDKYHTAGITILEKLNPPTITIDIPAAAKMLQHDINFFEKVDAQLIKRAEFKANGFEVAAAIEEKVPAPQERRTSAAAGGDGHRRIPTNDGFSLALRNVLAKPTQKEQSAQDIAGALAIMAAKGIGTILTYAAVGAIKGISWGASAIIENCCSERKKPVNQQKAEAKEAATPLWVATATRNAAEYRPVASRLAPTPPSERLPGAAGRMEDSRKIALGL